MDLEQVAQMQKSAIISRPDAIKVSIAVLFIIGVMLFAMYNLGDGVQVSYMLIVAAMIGGYMAMNIGANDVANNVGPAVGSKALTLAGAIGIAAIFEASGALIAGGDVVGTIKKGIIDPGLIDNTDTFIWLMLAALLAGAIWLNIATYLGAPVSTTHSIVGGVLGAGIAAGGLGIANWSTMGKIAASWVISPVIGGIIAAFFLYVIKRTITYHNDRMMVAAKRMVPILVACMAWAFSTYLIMKGLKKIVKVDFGVALMVGLAIAVAIYAILLPVVARRAKALGNDKVSVNKLFIVPLIFAAALLSFAHGANDVANAVGPLAAINDAIMHGGIAKKAAIPLWVMAVGGLGIAVGLALFGPKLIRTVGSEITELDQMRAFSIAMAAAITVIIASQLGLPVSSTHIAVGAVFGVGFLREFLKASYAKMIEEIKDHHHGKDEAEIEAYLIKFGAATIAEKGTMLLELKAHTAAVDLSKKERRGLQRVRRQELVKRSAVWKIVAAWVITVPASGLLAAMFYYTIRGIMLP